MAKKKQKKEHYCKRSYKEVWNYIKETKNYIWFVIGLFVLFILIGSLVPTPAYVSDYINNFIKELIEKTEGFTTFEMIRFLLINNSMSSFSSILFGIVLGIVPFFSTIANGYLLGYVSQMVVGKAGFLELWRLFPHGIFELPAALISFALGIKMGMFIFHKKPIKEFKRRFRLGMKTFLFVILPLLVIAAIIEGLLIIFFS